MKTIGYAAHSATDTLIPFPFERREPRPEDVAIDIMYCGIYHSDIHLARNEWGETHYPYVPGHEIIGRVSGDDYHLAGKRQRRQKAGWG
jgi:uncharacterized zinc-type alcohol dehydrogenase-like protein